MRTLDRHAAGIRLSSFLSKLPMIGKERSRREVLRMKPEDVIPHFKNKGLDFVLVGAHGIAGWLPEPRATQDVDLLIRHQDKSKAAAVVSKALPDLEVEKTPDVLRYTRGGKYVLDLMLNRSPLYKRVFKEFVETRLGRTTIRVPKVEAALAMKFAAMAGHYRKYEKKLLDGADFVGMAKSNTSLDLKLLTELGELISPGGGLQLQQYISDVRAGRKLEI